MKRFSKILLIAGGVLAVFYASYSATIAALTTLLLGYAGLGLTISGVVNLVILNNNADHYSSPENLESNRNLFLGLTGGGVAALITTIVITVLFFIIIAATLLSSIFAFVDVGALNDKKVGHVLAMVFAILALVVAFLMGAWLMLLIALIILLGAIFGLVALKKEKKVIEEEVPVK